MRGQFLRREAIGPLLAALLAVLMVACSREERRMGGPANEQAGTGGGSSPAASPSLPERVTFSTSGWRTDFSRHSVPLGWVLRRLSAWRPLVSHSPTDRTLRSAELAQAICSIAWRFGRIAESSAASK